MVLPLNAPALYLLQHTRLPYVILLGLVDLTRVPTPAPPARALRYRLEEPVATLPRRVPARLPTLMRIPIHCAVPQRLRDRRLVPTGRIPRPLPPDGYAACLPRRTYCCACIPAGLTYTAALLLPLNPPAAANAFTLGGAGHYQPPPQHTADQHCRLVNRCHLPHHRAPSRLPIALPPPLPLRWFGTAPFSWSRYTAYRYYTTLPHSRRAHPARACLRAFKHLMGLRLFLAATGCA